uniref:Uncharacterized protein n=1 Tax=Megaselia scalaris TaxID=36166 RepID=T1GE75_MEGSC
MYDITNETGLRLISSPNPSSNMLLPKWLIQGRSAKISSIFEKRILRSPPKADLKNWYCIDDC